MENETSGINSIIVIPRNERRARYIINNGAVHSASYTNIKDLIQELVSKSTFSKVIDFIRRYRTFFVSVDDDFAEELDFDFEEERKSIKNQTRKEFLKPEIAKRKYDSETVKKSSLEDKKNSLYKQTKEMGIFQNRK